MAQSTPDARNPYPEAREGPHPPGVVLVGVGRSARAQAACDALMAGLASLSPPTILILAAVPDAPIERHLQTLGAMPVEVATADTQPRPGRAYVVPADGVLTVEQGRFALRPRSDHPPGAIDALFTSGARSWGRRCAGMLLPDTREEGSVGVRAVLAEGGLAMVDPDGTRGGAMIDGLSSWAGASVGEAPDEREALRREVASLTRSNVDLQNLIAATQVATVFLDRSLAIQRFTPQAQALLNLRPEDVGRRLPEVARNLDAPHLERDAEEVLQTLASVSREVQTLDGTRWFDLRLTPYRTPVDDVDGLVLAFVDITRAKLDQQSLASRVRKQQLISAFGRFALQGCQLDPLLKEAVRVIQEGMGATRCVVLESLPQQASLQVRCSVGAQALPPGRELPADGRSLPGVALREQRVAHSDEAGLDPRSMVEQLGGSPEDVAIAAPVPGPGGPWGAICVFGPPGHSFAHDTDFLLTVANVLAEATERGRVHAQLQSQARRFELALRNSTTTVFEHDRNLQLSWIYNPPSGRPIKDVVGKTNADIYGGEDVPRLMAMERQVLATGKGARDTFTMRLGERELHLDVTMDALLDGSGQPIGVLGAAADVTHQKRIEQELRELNRTLEHRVEQRAGQVRQLATALTLAEQRERHRIAQVLHDHVQQLLYAVQLRLRLLAPQLDPAERAPLDEALGQALKAIRSMSVELSPPVLKDEGLPEALRWLVLQTKLVHGLRVELDASLPDLQLQRDVGMLLFHFVRELLFNVVKHAHTDRARVHLSLDGEDVVVTVEDDGAGFDPGAVASHSGFGLYGIRERLALFDGRLEVQSSPGEGTRVAMRIPVSRVHATA